MIKKKCTYCGKFLQAIGNARKNGKLHNDWSTRSLHKKCFIEIQNEKNRLEWLKNFNKL
jgi:hypothetical protein